MLTSPAVRGLAEPGSVGAHEALAALHRSPDLMDESGLAAGMPYDLVVLPEQPVLSEPSAAALESFLRRGGKLLTSGDALQSPRLQKLLGVDAVRFAAVADGHVFLKTSREPTGIDAPWDQARLGSETRELYPLYLSWDQFNPEAARIPNNWPMHGQADERKPERAGLAAAFARRIGKGTAVHVAAPIFARYGQYGDPQMLRWLREIVDFLQPEPLVATDAPGWVDLSLRRKGDDWIVHLVSQNPGRDVARLNTDDTWVDEIPTVGPITLRLRMAERPAEVVGVPADGPLAWQWDRGLLKVVVPRLTIHTAVVIRSAAAALSARAEDAGR